MTLPVLYPHQRSALNEALTHPRHWIHAAPGLGSSMVQAYIAQEWNALIIAPARLHQHWKSWGMTNLRTPQYLAKHPELLQGQPLVVDECSWVFAKNAWTRTLAATKLSLRTSQEGNIRVEPMGDLK